MVQRQTGRCCAEDTSRDTRCARLAGVIQKPSEFGPVWRNVITATRFIRFSPRPFSLTRRVHLEAEESFPDTAARQSSVQPGPRGVCDTEVANLGCRKKFSVFSSKIRGHSMFSVGTRVCVFTCIYACVYVYVHTSPPVDLMELTLRVQQSRQRPLPWDIAKEKRWPCPSSL